MKPNDSGSRAGARAGAGAGTGAGIGLWVVGVALAGLLPWTAVSVLAAGAAGVPDDRVAGVVVLYNASMPDSLAVARHYAEVRGVPTNRLVGLSLPQTENVTRAEYESRLQGPFVTELESRGLWRVREDIQPATEARPGRVLQSVTNSEVRTVVVCYGVPLRVTDDSSRKDPEVASLPEGYRRNGAAVDAELTVLPLLLGGQVIGGPIANPLYGLTNTSLIQARNGLLVVGRLDGPSAALSAALVDRAVEAERSGLLGRAYVDLRAATDPAYMPGDRWLSNAWSVAKGYGFDGYLDNRGATLPAGFPLSHVALYAGWYAVSATGPFAAPQVEFMPGAIAYHLHSFSAATLRSTSNHWVGPLVARGVTATMGTVAEPYLDGTPDIGMAWSRLMYFGFTWGEAAIAAQRMLSWQLTVVGDPLYRPFATNALARAKDLAQRRDGRVDWALTLLYNRRRETGGAMEGILKDLEGEPRLKFSSVLQEKLAEFHRDAGNRLRAAELFRSASRLNTSPMQRRRLIWNAAESWEQAGREREAYEAYESLVKDGAVNPDPVLLFERLRELAGKLRETNDLRRWTTELERARASTPP